MTNDAVMINSTINIFDINNLGTVKPLLARLSSDTPLYVVNSEERSHLDAAGSSWAGKTECEGFIWTQIIPVVADGWEMLSCPGAIQRMLPRHGCVFPRER